MPEICAKHNLVLASDGRCVLCRRTVSQHARRRFGAQENVTVGERVLTLALGLCLAGAIGSVYALSRTQHHRAPRAARTLHVNKRASTSASAAVKKADAKVQPAAAATTTTAVTDTPTQESGDQPPDLRGPLPLTAAVDSHSLDDARKRVTIDMYATSWCYVCDWAREDLARRGLAYRELDPDRDTEIAKHLAKINRLESLPTFEIDGETLVGYGSATLNQAIERAALRRAQELEPQRQPLSSTHSSTPAPATSQSSVSPPAKPAETKAPATP